MILTKRSIDAAEPTARRYVLWDNEIPGLGLVVLPSGRKSFVLKYRTRDGIQRKPTIGTYGAITLHQARELARDMLHTVYGGGDPSAERVAARQAATVKEAWKRFMEAHVARNKLATREQYESIGRRFVVPVLGSRKIASITRQHISDLISRVGAQYPFLANRIRSILSKFMNEAERWGMRPDNSNPCRLVMRFPEPSRHRHLDLLEARRLGRVLAQSHGKLDPRALDIIRLLHLTGVRFSNIVELRWAEVDLHAGVLRLRDTKTGPKTVPIGKPAIEILVRLSAHRTSQYVFPSPRVATRPISGPMVFKVWKEVRDAARLGERDGLRNFRLHDFRHNFATAGASNNLSLATIGHLLGHTEPRTTARYASLMDAPARNAADQIAAVLHEQVLVAPNAAEDEILDDDASETGTN